jgi:hypothetical protein
VPERNRTGRDSLLRPIRNISPPRVKCAGVPYLAHCARLSPPLKRSIAPSWRVPRFLPRLRGRWLPSEPTGQPERTTRLYLCKALGLVLVPYSADGLSPSRHFPAI